MTSKATANPFEFATSDTNATTSRKLDYTPQLIALCNQRATNLMVGISKRPELMELANRTVDDGAINDLLQLINAFYSQEQIVEDAAVLDGASDDILDRLLASRQSDRSKAKAKGLRQNSSACQTYISAMYAELLIREKSGKAYAGAGQSAADVDTSDAEAIKRRVKSLQTKKCRLLKLAQYDTAAAEELVSVNDEINRLNGFRPTVRVTSKTTVNGVDIATLREALSSVDVATLSADQAEKYAELMAKLG